MGPDRDDTKPGFSPLAAVAWGAALLLAVCGLLSQFGDDTGSSSILGSPAPQHAPLGRTLTPWLAYHAPPVNLESPSRIWGPINKVGPPAVLHALNKRTVAAWAARRAAGEQSGHLPTCAMWYSDEYKFIFLKNPKTAGTTVSSYFGMCDAPDPKPYCLKVTRGGDPAIVRHLLERWDDYFVFAFSRNVWRRAISQYQYLTSSEFMDPGGGCQVAWGDFCADPNVLGDICRARPQCCSISDREQYVHAMPQSRCLLADDQYGMAVDFLGRVEHFAADFATLISLMNNRRGMPQLPMEVPPKLNSLDSPCAPDSRRRLAYRAAFNPCNKMRFFDGNHTGCVQGIANFFADDLLLLHQ